MLYHCITVVTWRQAWVCDQRACHQSSQISCTSLSNWHSDTKSIEPLRTLHQPKYLRWAASGGRQSIRGSGFAWDGIVVWKVADQGLSRVRDKWLPLCSVLRGSKQLLQLGSWRWRLYSKGNEHNRKVTDVSPCLLFFLLVAVMDGRLLLDGLPRFGAVPTYLPVQYQVLNAELAFFLKEANQDIMRNSSLQARTELFFIQQARRMPMVNASYGPLSVQQPVPMELLGSGLFNQPSSSSPSSSQLFTFNWKVQTFIINERIHPSWPKVQVLFYVVGRNWDDYSTVDRLPCVRMFAFHETQEVRGTCRLKGELGLCVAELEPLPSWFSPPSVVPGRQKAPEQAEGTPVELYYMVQSTDSGDCNSEDSRKTSSIPSEHQGPAGYFSGPTPMRRIGSVRLFQPLSELRLDSNFVVMVPSRPIKQRETVSAFLAASTLSSVEIFTLRWETVPIL